MYQVAADIHNIEVRKALLTEDYQLNSREVLHLTDEHTRVIFLCSPNNPTGNLLDPTAVLEVITGCRGMVVLDEAYIDFAPEYSWLKRLDEFPNLIILQTLSKAWGMAGIRLGMAFCQPEVIALLNKIKYPYNLNILTQQKALKLLQNNEQKEEWVRLLLQERAKMVNELKSIPVVNKIFPSDANFILVQVENAAAVYKHLLSRGIVVRDRSRVVLCGESLRITIGTPEENIVLIEGLKLC
jgi:histidinol-phosphate aminotransferase